MCCQLSHLSSPRATQRALPVYLIHPLYAKSNSQELFIIVTSVDHVKFGLIALERKENEKAGRCGGGGRSSQAIL